MDNEGRGETGAKRERSSLSLRSGWSQLPSSASTAMG